MGQSPDSNSYNDLKKGIPLIQGNADILGRKTCPSRYTEKPTKMCEKGDIVMTVRAPVGYVCKSEHIACIGRGVCSIKPRCNNEFLFQFLINIENRWKKQEQGSTFTAINSKDLKELNIIIPCLEEQEKIANILSSADKMKTSLEEKVKELKELKQGLLQKIFS